ISREAYIDSLTDFLTATALLQPILAPQINYTRGVMLASLSPVRDVSSNLALFESTPAVPMAAVEPCPGYCLLTPCVCAKMDQLLSNPDVQDLESATWAAYLNCPSMDIKLIMDVCQTSYMSEEGKNIDNMDSEASWEEQARLNLEAAAEAYDLYIPAEC